MHDKKPKKIKDFSAQELNEDMEKYRQAAIDLGAADAWIVPAEKIPVEKRVRFKCMIPKCPECGLCANCPPHSPDTGEIRELVSGYKYALLVKLNIESSTIVGDKLGVIDEGGSIVPSKTLKKLLQEYRKLNDLVTDIESLAFYDGHYLATAFSAGDCFAVYCNFKECQVLKGLSCRFPLRARPSMESASINAYKMAAEAGWDIYPIGSHCNPENVPHGTLLGLVLVE